jgi:hypothetical protein
MRKLLLTTTVIAAASVISGSGHATVYDITSYGLSHGLSDTLYSPLLDNHGPSEGTLSGEIQLKYNGTGSPLDVFCTDITHILQETGYFTTAPFGTGQDDPHYTTTQGDEIGWLIDNYDKAQNMGSMSTDQFSSATQLAIWSLEYAVTSSGASTATNAWDYTNATQAGEFAFNSDASALNGQVGDVSDLIGDALLAYSESDASTDPTELLPSDSQGNINLGLNQAQSYIPVDKLNNDEPLPEPFSMTLLGTGLIGLGLVRRKRRG